MQKAGGVLFVVAWAIVIFAVLPAVYSQSPTPVPLPPGESVLACTNNATVTLVPPDRAICPPATPAPTRTATPSPTVTATVTAAPPPLPGFLETFDGAPGTPQAFRPSARWDVTIHSRDTFYNLDPMPLDHSPVCHPPPTQHESIRYEDAVFLCANHLMVGIRSDGGYALVELTPNHMVDFSQGEAVISWRMSTFRASIDRSWVDVWICPFEDCLQLPLQFSYPDLQGPPRNGLLIRMQATRNSFEVFRVDNFAMTRVGGGFVGYDDVAMGDRRVTPSRLVRDLFEIRLTAGSIKVSMPERGIVFVNRTLTPALPWRMGAVQWGIHDYNSNKSVGSLCVVALPCTATTWHFDDFSISPAVSFTTIPADRRYYRDDVNVVTFSTPSPANAYLRFAGIGEDFEISTDRGVTWQTAVRQPGGNAHNEGHFASYRTPMAAGVTEVWLKGGRWWGGGWMARDVSMWARVQP